MTAITKNGEKNRETEKNVGWTLTRGEARLFYCVTCKGTAASPIYQSRQRGDVDIPRSIINKAWNPKYIRQWPQLRHVHPYNSTARRWPPALGPKNVLPNIRGYGLMEFYILLRDFFSRHYELPQFCHSLNSFAISIILTIYNPQKAVFTLLLVSSTTKLIATA